MRRRGRNLTAMLTCLCLAATARSQAHAASDEQDPGAGDVVALRDPQARPFQVRSLPAEQAQVYGYKHPYRFSTDWFSKNIGLWAALLRPQMGRAGVQYLEVGVYEGRSLLWVIDNVLTHPDSSATGIDIKIRGVLRRNLELSGASDRTTLIHGYSQIELRKLPAESYNIIYIDGSHTAPAVLEDIVLSWRLLKPGGLLILDDHGFLGMVGSDDPLPPELRPQLAIGSFISTYRSFVKVMHLGYQVALRKRKGVCPRVERHCSTLGHYAYYWRSRALYEDEKKVELSEAERKIVESLIRGKRGDALSIELARTLYESAAFASLNKRLGLGLTERLPRH